MVKNLGALLVGLLMVNSVVAQTPGGVPTNLSVWLKADAGVVGVSPVTTWNDQSVNGNNASSVGNSPDLIANAINFNPALDFVSANNEYLNILGGVMGNTTQNDLWVYAVSQVDAVQNNTLFYEQGVGAEYTTGLLPWGNGNTYFDFGNASTGRINTAWGGTVGNINLWTYATSTSTATPNGTHKAIARDGAVIAGNNNNSSLLGGGNDMLIGAGYNNGAGTTNNLDGKIAELIVYTGIPTALEQEKIQSYLAVKYGITKMSQDLGATTEDERDYFASDASVIWDYSTNSGHNANITGVGRDDNQGLSQTQSYSVNSNGSVMMNHNTTFTSDMDFILFGDDGAHGASLDVPGGYVSRSNRVWKIQSQGTAGLVTIQVDLNRLGVYNSGNVADYAMLLDADGIFNAGATIHTTGMTLVGDLLTFTNVPMANGTYFSFAIPLSTPNPGGVTESLALWLKADAGVTGATPVTGWDNQTNGNFDATAVGNSPDLLTNAINFNPAMDFDSANDEYLSIPGGIMGNGNQNDLWVYAVTQVDVVQNNTLFYERGSGTDYTTGLLPWGNGNTYFDFGNASTGRINTAWGGTVGNINLWTYASSTSTATPNGTHKAIARDGVVIAGNNNNSSLLGGGNDMLIGAGYNNGAGTTNNLDGKIAEFIVYTGVPTALEQEKIQSYLAVKYGITKMSQDLGATTEDERDYFASDASVIWDYSTNSGHSANITGVGRDDNQGLSQTQSYSVNSNGSVMINHNTTFASDMDFILFGDDGAHGASLDVPGGYVSRSNRVWKIQSQGTAGLVTIQVDLNRLGVFNSGNVADYAMLLDTDGIFNAGATIHTTGMTLVGDLLTFTNVPMANGTYFSFAIPLSTPNPGGVTESLALWLKADAGVTGATPVTGWDNQTNGNFDATAVGNSPDLLTNAINFNPAMDFDSANDEYLSISGGIMGNGNQNDVWVYAVTQVDVVQNNTLFYERGSGTDYTTGLLPWGNGNTYFDFGNASTGRINTAWGGTVGNINLWTFATSTSTATPNGTHKAIARDGAVIAGNNNNSSLLGGGNDMLIGGGYNNGAGTTNNLDGKIAELIVYTGIPTALEQEKIQSYLAVKYGITKMSQDLGATTEDERDYFASDASVIWDYSANAGHSTNITGVGRDDNQGLSQTQSYSVNSNGSVMMNHNVTFASDMDFILFGDDGAHGASLDVPGGYVSRSNRVWKIQSQGTAGLVTIQVDLNRLGVFNSGNVADYAMLLDADGIFNAGATIHTTGMTLVGDLLTFTNVPMANGTYFSFAIPLSTPNPGGVTESLALWLKADAGVTGATPVTGWDNQTNGNFDATAVGNSPDLLTNAINFNPAMDFDSANDEYLSISGGIMGNGNQNDLWVYAVTQVDVVQNNTLFYERGSGTDYTTGLLPWGNGNTYFDFGNASTGRINTAWGGTVGNINLWTYASSTSTATPNGTHKAIARDGAVIAGNNSNASLLGGGNDMLIGGGYNNGAGTTNNLDGKIAELIIYTGIPTALEQEKIQSYLAVKYGITKMSQDLGATTEDERDYFAANGDVMWDYSVNSVYHNDVTGIGQDDDQGLLQTNSMSVNTGSILRIANPTNLQNLEYFITGDNGIDPMATNTADIPTAAPELITYRLERVWRAEENNGDVGAMFLEFQSALTAFAGLTVVEVKLLIDKNQNGIFADETYAGGGVIDATGGGAGTFDFSGINLVDGERYTLAVNTLDPLPVTLISFDAQTFDNRTVDISWQTASELNNDYFRVQQSSDLETWREVAMIEGNGTSEEVLNYFAKDYVPNLPISYYRLVQVDYDGTETISAVKAVNFEQGTGYSIIPNPSTGQFVVENTRQGDAVEIIDLRGNVVKSIQLASSNQVLNFQELEAGVYLVKVNQESVTRLVIR